MHLKVVHSTGYEYGDQVGASYNEARLTPLTRDGQLVTQTRVEVVPKPWTYGYRDHWGTLVTAFEVLAPHRTLQVVATSTVHTSPHNHAGRGLSWADLAACADAFAEYLMTLDRVRPPADLVAIVERIRHSHERPAGAARAICDLLHDEVAYRTGTTQVQTVAATAWEQRSGVCQDIAHLAVGCLRWIGIPARYVSGYLHPQTEPALGETVTGESHAWIEWWDGAWHGYDPTNQIVPDERYVTVATGRNYDDVRPLSGIYTGGGRWSRMFVNVEISRLS